MIYNKEKANQKACMKIRKIRIEDLASFKTLLAQLGYDKPIEYLRNKLEHQLKEDMYEILVAEDNEVILGFVSMFFFESFVSDKCMRIKSLVIDQNARREGIGTQLMLAAEKLAYEQGCSFIELITLNHRKKDGIEHFYENLGYKNQDQSEFTYFSKILRDLKVY